MSAGDDLREIAVEKSQKQSTDVGAVHVGVGHDDYLVVSKLGQIKLFGDGCTHGDNESSYLLRRQHFVQPSFFYIENLSSKREDCLGVPVSCLLRAIMDKYSAGQSKIMSSRHLQIINIHPFL